MARHEVTISVPLVQGKARPRFTRGGHTYTPTSTRVAEEAVAAEWQAKSGGLVAPAHVPVTVEIVIERELPKGRPKYLRRESDTFKPDIDNVAKLVLDALNGVAWADDAQVTRLYVRKADRKREQTTSTTIVVCWQEE